jgi:hypothetical protein
MSGASAHAPDIVYVIYVAGTPYAQVRLGGRNWFLLEVEFRKT